METRSLILCIFATLPSVKANCFWLAQQSVSSINLYSSQNTLGVSDIEFPRQWRPEKYLSWEWNPRALPKLQLPCLSLTSFQSLNAFCTNHYTLQHFFQESAHNSRNPTPQVNKQQWQKQLSTGKAGRCWKFQSLYTNAVKATVKANISQGNQVSMHGLDRRSSGKSNEHA